LTASSYLFGTGRSTGFAPFKCEEDLENNYSEIAVNKDFIELESIAK
jgi:hypothetical protein